MKIKPPPIYPIKVHLDKPIYFQVITKKRNGTNDKFGPFFTYAINEDKSWAQFELERTSSFRLALQIPNKGSVFYSKNFSPSFSGYDMEFESIILSPDIRDEMGIQIDIMNIQAQPQNKKALELVKRKLIMLGWYFPYTTTAPDHFKHFMHDTNSKNIIHFSNDKINKLQDNGQYKPYEYDEFIEYLSNEH